jgi:hypothetical protein
LIETRRLRLAADRDDSHEVCAAPTKADPALLDAVFWVTLSGGCRSPRPGLVDPRCAWAEYIDPVGPHPAVGLGG